MGNTTDGFKIPDKIFYGFLIAELLLLILFFFSKDWFTSKFEEYSIPLVCLKFNFDNVCLALLTASIGYPIFTQFIRHEIDDIDVLITRVEHSNLLKSKKDRDNVNNKLRKQRIDLQSIHLFPLFGKYIFLAFTLLFLSLVNNAISNKVNYTPSHIVFMNVMIALYALTCGIFLTIQISYVSKYLLGIKEKSAKVESLLVKSKTESILDSLEN